QLVSLARRPDRAAKIYSPERRRDGRFTAHRYSEKRRKAGEPPRRRSQLSRHRQPRGMDGHEAGAGNFRRGARECGETKKIIKTWDSPQRRRVHREFFYLKLSWSALFVPLWCVSENLRGVRKLLGRLTTVVTEITENR